MTDTVEMVGLFMSMTERTKDIPGEDIESIFLTEASHRWLANHQRVYESLSVNPKITPSEQIEKLMTADIETMIDNLMSIGITLMESIEYLYSTSALSYHVKIGASGKLSAMSTITGEVVELDGDPSSVITKTSDLLVARRIENLPMQMDHLKQVIGAIRVLLVLQESKGFSRVEPFENPDMDKAVADFFDRGKEVDKGSVAQRLPKFFTKDGAPKHLGTTEGEDETTE